MAIVFGLKTKTLQDFANKTLQVLLQKKELSINECTVQFSQKVLVRAV